MTVRARQVKFLELLEPVYPRLSRYALGITRNAEEAEDLTSDAVLIALEQFEKIEADQFAGFLFKVASRLHKRKRHRERLRIPFDTSAAETRRDLSPLPDSRTEVAIVLAALDLLPHKTRETILLFDVADLPLEAIRTIQGGTLSGVKSRLKRGREQIQTYLGIEETVSVIVGEKPLQTEKAILKERREYYAL